MSRVESADVAVLGDACGFVFSAVLLVFVTMLDALV
jgi:tetrahydromethanopterin S-methyltransferase subunit F